MTQITLTFGGYQGPNSVHTRAGRLLCDEISRRCGDEVRVEFRENIVAQGHKAADLLTMTEEGVLDGCYFSSSYLADRVPELGVFDQHFKVPDRATAYRLLDGPLGRRFAELTDERTGYEVLGFWDNGFRHITSAHQPMIDPDACVGLKIRTLKNDQHQRVFKALGFEPRQIDVRDLPEAVHTGVVDAQENPLTNTFNFGLHKTHRHIALTRHLLGVALVLFNKSKTAQWPPHIRSEIIAAIELATAAQRRFADQDDTICAEKLRQAGVSIHELSNEERNRLAACVAHEVDVTRAQYPDDLIALFDADLEYS